MGFDNLILIGMPGSGKTTVGKLLAEKLSMAYIDTDLLIEQVFKEPIHDIFYCYGEKVFRSIEQEVIKKVQGMKNVIIATGGGVWMDRANRIMLAQCGKVIYLNCPPEELWMRLKDSGAVRPLLQGGLDALKDLYRMRHRRYMTADLVVNTSGKTVEEIATFTLTQIGSKRVCRDKR